MIETIKEDELEFMEDFYNPVSMIECLFGDFDNLGRFDEDEFGNVRNGQLPLLSYEYLIDTEDPKLNEDDNFKLKEGAGTLYCVGARKFGKTLVIEKLDILISILLSDGEWAGLASLDAVHVRGVMEDIIRAIDRHSFYKIFGVKTNKSPNYRISSKNGYLLESVNMNLFSRSPGDQFFGKHFNKLYIEECSFETETVYKKRLDATAEDGCIVRAAGMTNFTRYSPMGEIFNDLDRKSWICNLPQYINPKWDEKKKEGALKEHGGENTMSYRMFVKGEVLQDGVGEFDMEKVKENYDEDRMVKTFEINKTNFGIFKNILILDKPKQTERVWISSDIGESAPTEIIINFEFDSKLHYEYKITILNLTDKQQFEIFAYITDLLEPNFLGLDCTEGTGRAIFRRLEEKYGRDFLVWVSFNAKLVVGFDKDNEGNIIFKNGKPVETEEYVSEWSVKILKEMLYEGKFVLPIDYQFHKQLNSVISTLSGTRRIYACASTEDHLFCAFKVLAISFWTNEFNTNKYLQTKKFSKVGV